MGFRLKHSVTLLCLLLASSAAYPSETRPTARAERLRQIVSNLATKLSSDPSDQGWLATYGKRQETGLDYDVSDFEDTWDAIDEDIIKKQKRQQGWETMYGKRNNDDVISYYDIPFDDSTDEVTKRQQGWYTQYGKRTSNMINKGDLIAPDMLTVDKEPAVMNRSPEISPFSYGSENAGYPNFVDKRQQGWHSTYGKRDADIFNIASKRQQGWHSMYGKRGAGPLSKRQQGWNTMYGKRATNFLSPKEKRQQGWYQTYGKRATDVKNLVDRQEQLDSLHKRQQGWHTMYGKRSAEAPVNKRQQGWETGYGKRAGDVPLSPLVGQPEAPVNKRQQGWETPYGKRAGDVPLSPLAGKREASVNKRQQGWETPYGKRAGDVPLSPLVGKRRQLFDVEELKFPLSTPSNGYDVAQELYDPSTTPQIIDRSSEEPEYNSMNNMIRSPVPSLSPVRSFQGPRSTEVLASNYPSPYVSGSALRSDESRDWNSGRWKRQQGWHNPYGKRSGKWERQQGWHNPYGKRSGRWKRQQGWHNPYGKRSVRDRAPFLDSDTASNH